MVPFDQILFHASAIRPEHVTIADPRLTLRTLVHTIEDPYYSHSHPNHHNSLSPRFDIRESDSAFFLEGEFPGIARKEDIMIEKLGDRTLLVQTTNRRFNVDEEWNQHEPATHTNAEAQQQRPRAANLAKSGSQDREGDLENSSKEKEEGFHIRLDERRIGHLQRSFTFPSAVNIDALKARLRHGLLVMMVPKVRDARGDSRRICIED
jgi:HSP20 family molecular chaperone IbpA